MLEAGATSHVGVIVLITTEERYTLYESLGEKARSARTHDG
jgi:hypothetical protein